MAAASSVTGLAIEMHHQRERPIVVQLARPVDDEGLGVGVEVALAEWRRVHRVEELVQLADVDLDDLAARRERIADAFRRRRGVLHLPFIMAPGS